MHRGPPPLGPQLQGFHGCGEEPGVRAYGLDRRGCHAAFGKCLPSWALSFFLLTLNRVGRGVEEPGRVGSALTSPFAPPLCGSAGWAHSSP